MPKFPPTRMAIYASTSYMPISRGCSALLPFPEYFPTRRRRPLTAYTFIPPPPCHNIQHCALAAARAPAGPGAAAGLSVRRRTLKYSLTVTTSRGFECQRRRRARSCLAVISALSDLYMLVYIYLTIIPSFLCFPTASSVFKWWVMKASRLISRDGCDMSKIITRSQHVLFLVVKNVKWKIIAYLCAI